MEPKQQPPTFVYELTNQGVDLLLNFLEKLDNIKASEVDNFYNLRTALRNPIPKDQYVAMLKEQEMMMSAPVDTPKLGKPMPLPTPTGEETPKADA